MNQENIFFGVEDTLYIPLVSRIYVSKRFPTFFYDEKALSLENYISADIIEKQSGEYECLASACRQYMMDKKITSFLQRNPSGNVVFLGAGLETALYRLEKYQARFFQVDLPEVIALREKLLGKNAQEQLISGDMFALDWLKAVDTTLPTMLIVSGVFQYFYKENIVSMIQAVAAALPKGELVFDATNSKGLQFANQYVRKTGNKGAEMYFSVDDPNSFANETGTKLVSVDGFFREALQACVSLKFRTRLFMYLADRWKRTMIIHLAF